MVKANNCEHDWITEEVPQISGYPEIPPFNYTYCTKCDRTKSSSKWDKLMGEV